MANKKANTVKRFVESISKEVADAAYNGGGGGSSDGFFEIPRKSIITVDFNKMLNLLIKKGFDVDVEIPSEAAGYDSGVQFGNWSSDPFSPYPGDGNPNSFRTNEIVFNQNHGTSTYYAYVNIMGFETINIDVTSPTTVKQMLTAAGTKTSAATPASVYVIPFLSAKNGSTDVYTIYKLTAEEYKSFITVTPTENNSSTPSTGGEPDPLGPILPINPGQ